LSTGQKPERAELLALAANVKLLIFDVDGVLTDGGLYYGHDGEAMKRFDVKDGHALVMARLVGLPAAALTARQSRILEVRAAELGFVGVLQGYRDKRAGLDSLCQSQQITPQMCAYMGDDLNDLGPMAEVGLSACPADAAPEVRQAAAFVAQSPGGRGAVRELVELCLKASGRFEKAMALMNPTARQP
jgi:3-deoxy-D-manno-octulosonate 8-phosphate phosphatase (KDO 8-P phosphatase)